MKTKISYAVICMLFLVLTGCNKDEAALDPNPTLNNDSISSMHTDTNSKNYPHTVPIKVKEAKYEFRTITGSYPSNTGKSQNQASNVERPAQEQQQAPSTQQAPNATPAKQTETKQEAKAASGFVASVIELTNAERKKQGLPALQAYPELNNVADVKAKDMNEKGYFSHTSPTYGSPFDMMRDFGIDYKSAGENIAQGQQTPEEVVDAWMNSEGHRANILNKEYTHIGVGFDQPGYEWVQMFVKK